MKSPRHWVSTQRLRGPSTSRGQGLAEYALILTLIAIVAILALAFIGGNLSTMLSNVGHSV